MSIEENTSNVPNRIEVSPFGTTFLKDLASEMTESPFRSVKQNYCYSSGNLRRRGQGLNFNNFANQTQNMLHRELSSMTMMEKKPRGSFQSRRKLKLHHDNWVNEQKLIREKVGDTQVRRQLNNFSEYDWKQKRVGLKLQEREILGEWDAKQGHRNMRSKQKIKRLYLRKYSNSKLPRCCSIKTLLF